MEYTERLPGVQDSLGPSFIAVIVGIIGLRIDA